MNKTSFNNHGVALPFSKLSSRHVASFLLATAVLITLLALPLRASTQNAPTVIDSFAYGQNAAARAAWRPMAGSAPVEAAVIEGRNVLRMPCKFASNAVERASWDKAVKLDLSSCTGFEFKILCHDASPVMHFDIYLQSGEGWYRDSFFPDSTKGWNTISLDKSTMQSEGTTAGWDKIKTIRISAWRGKSADTEFYLEDMHKKGELGAGSVVMILRSETAAKHWPEQVDSFNDSVDKVTQAFQSFGVGCPVISDTELTPALLDLTKLVVLPQDPILSDAATTMLKDYVAKGGKLMGFYIVPDGLLSTFGVESNQMVKAERPGGFEEIQFGENSLPGAPPVVEQDSQNISGVNPIKGVGRTLADWADDTGKSTGHPAVVATENTMLMTYILLEPAPAEQKKPTRIHRPPAALTGKLAEGRGMVLAMAGKLVPQVWRQAVNHSLERVGHVASFSGYAEAVEQIGRSGGADSRVKQELSSTTDLRDAAKEYADLGKYIDAIQSAEDAGKHLKTAYCLAQKPLPGEFRAFWCHSALGVPGIDWDEAIHRLAENGFTAIFPNMVSGGVAFYPSKVLPVAGAVSKKGDQLTECIAACRKYGIQIHVWKLNWNLGGFVPKEFVDRMRSENRLQKSSEGAEELWLCPSHPENQKLEIAAMVELARDYDVDGIHFDYIRYPGPDYCFCDGCRERFEKTCAKPLQNWPAEVLPKGPFHQQWLDWRRSNINTVVKAVSEQARAIKPKIKISAAVFRYWNVDRDGVGQDWKMWCEKGYLDFICPMDYTPIKARFEDMVSQQVKWAGKTPCYPGLGASASTSKFGVDRAIEEINITRQYKTGGFIIFNYGASESSGLLPMLGMGIAAKSPVAVAH